MSKKITFGIDNFKFLVETAPYGYTVTPVSNNPNKSSVCCIGDYDIGCIFARKEGKKNAVVTYCYPYSIAEEPEYSSQRWRDIAKEFTTKLWTPNDKILIARPIIEDNAVIGVHFLTQDTRDDPMKDVIQIRAKKKEDGSYTMVTHMNAHILNPEY